ncbi:hypothetical protein C9439_03255 [archaeon SCG-AAA382B04]|nr:hypothetical protein C9439_03255 [archaeon SCG-AAA382B04]
MYLIIGGCGRLGSTLAKLFSIEGNEVVVIDKKEEALNRLGNEFGGSKIKGNFSDQSVLENAGAKNADAVIAVTDEDNTNVIGCQIAKEFFNVNKTVARINDPKHKRTYDEFNIDSLIAPFDAVTNVFKNAVIEKDYITREIIGENEIELIEVRVDKDDLGTIEEFKPPKGVRLVAINKDGEAKLAEASDEINKGDRLFFLIESREIKKNKDWLKKWR